MASDHVFKRPERLIKKEDDMDKWLHSEVKRSKKPMHRHPSTII